MSKLFYLLIVFVQVLTATEHYYFNQVTFNCNLISSSELSELEATKKYLEKEINSDEYVQLKNNIDLSEFNCLSKALNIEVKTIYKILNSNENDRFKELFILNNKYAISLGDDFYIIFSNKALDMNIKQLIKKSSDNDLKISKKILDDNKKEFEKNIATHKAISLNDFYQDIELIKYRCQNNEFNSKKNIPNTNELFLYQIANNLCLKESLNKYFNLMNSVNIITKTQLYKTPSEDSITKMYLVEGDKADLLEEKIDEKGVKWYNILYHGKKDINAWIKADSSVNLETKNN